MIVSDIGQFFQAVCEAKDKKDCGINTQRNTGITLFGLAQCCAGNHHPFSHQCRWNAPLDASNADIATRFLECTLYWQG
jgi:hypothetical protein